MGLFAGACASRGNTFVPASEARAALALEAWQGALTRAGDGRDSNLLYDARLSQGVLRTDGTLAVRLRGDRVEGSLSGPFGSPIAVYENGELRGEKLRPVRLPPRELRALLAGVWPGAAPSVVGERGSDVLLRWAGEDPADGVFDTEHGRLRSLRVDRAEGQLEARFPGGPNPWPDRIEIEEKQSGSTLRLKLISRETSS